MKKKKGIIVAVCVFCLLIGLGSTGVALKIRHQSRQIREDAALIDEQRGIIDKQYQESEERYQKLGEQYAQSRLRVTEAYAREALGYLEEDRMRGLTVGVMAWQEYLEGMGTGEQAADCPPSLTYSLTELLYLYENGEQIRPDRIIETRNTIHFMKVSPEGSRLMAVGDSGRVTVWEGLHDDLEHSFRPEGVNLSWECQVGFLSEDKILYPQKAESAQGEELCVKDLETREVTAYPCTNYEGVVPIPEREAFLVVEKESCFLVGADGKVSDRLLWEQLEEGLYAGDGFASEQTATEDGRIEVALELTAAGGDKRTAVLQYHAVLDDTPDTSLYSGGLSDADSNHVEAMDSFDGVSSDVKAFARGDGYWAVLPHDSNRIMVYRRALGEGVNTFYKGEDSYRQARLSGDGKWLAAIRFDDDFETCVEMFDTAEKKRLWTYEDTACFEAFVFGDFDGDGTERLLIVTDAAYHIIDPADGTVRRTVDFGAEGLSYLGIDRKNGVLSMEKEHTLYGYRLTDGELLYEEAVADGITAVCNGRPFYAVASREADTILYYEMGKEDVYMEIPSYDMDVEYLETMFFNEEDDKLYLVYQDGIVRIFFVDWDENMDVYFSDSLGSYAGFPGGMNRYEAAGDADYAFLCGDDNAYQLVIQGGQRYSKLAQIHGFLAYDAASKTLYLHSGGEIYTSPLYSMEETVDMARKVLQHSSSYWNYTERWPYCLKDK